MAARQYSMSDIEAEEHNTDNNLIAENKLEKLEIQHRETLVAAEAFYDSVRCFNAATIDILKAKSFSHFLTILNTTCRKYFHIDDIVLLIDGSENTEIDKKDAPLVIAPTGTASKYFHENGTLSHPKITLRKVSNFTLGLNPPMDGSEAVLLLDLGPDHVDVILTFFSSLDYQFSPEQNVVLLDFFRKVVETQLIHWLDN